MIDEVLTIGAYGFEEGPFLEALRRAGVDLFIDIRARRGVRGSEYAFANATRLQALLERAGIPYTHVPALAPPDALRQAQYRADAAERVSQRRREHLSPAFVKGYTASRLRRFNAAEFVETVCGTARRPALFCVEGHPAACHRSLAAAEIARQLSIPVRHLTP